MEIKNQNNGMLYSVLLSRAKVPMIFSDEVVVFQRKYSTIKSFAIEKFDEITDKIKTLYYCLKLFGEPICWKSKELLFSIIYPGDFVITVLFASLIYLAITNQVGGVGYIPHYLVMFCIISAIYAFILSKLSFMDLLVFPIKIIASPIIIISKFLSEPKHQAKTTFKTPKQASPKPGFQFKMPQFKFPEFKFKKKKPKNTTNVFVTNGTRDIACELEIEFKDGMYSSILWFNNKKLRSNKFSRANDSLSELSERLYDRGLALKVCQNCGYFELSPNNHYDFVNGGCLLGIVKHGQKEPYSTQISNNCKFIVPAHAKDYVRQQIKDLQT